MNSHIKSVVCLEWLFWNEFCHGILFYTADFTLLIDALFCCILKGLYNKKCLFCLLFCLFFMFLLKQEANKTVKELIYQYITGGPKMSVDQRALVFWGDLVSLGGPGSPLDTLAQLDSGISLETAFLWLVTIIGSSHLYAVFN